MSRSIEEVIAIAHESGARAAQGTAHDHALAQERLSAIHDLDAATKALGSRLDVAVGLRRQRIHALRARVTSMREHLAGSISEVDAMARELEQSLHAQRDHLDATFRDAVHAQDALHGELTRFTHSVADQDAHVSSGGNHLAHETDTMIGQLHEQVAHARDHLGSLEHDTSARIDRVVHELHHTGQRAGHLGVALTSTLHAAKGRFHDATERSMIHDAIGALDTSSDRLHQALDGLGHGALSELQNIEGAGGGVLRAVEDVLRVIEAIKPALDLVHAMLG